MSAARRAGPDGVPHDEAVEDLDVAAPSEEARDDGDDGARSGHPVRGGDGRRRLLLAALAVVVALGAGTAARLAAGSGPRAPDPPDPSATAEELFPVLARQPEAAEAELDSYLGAGLGVVPGSPRQLAATPTAVYWVASTSSGGVCLLVRETEGAGSSVGSCATSRDVATRGLLLPGAPGSSAALVPAGLDTSALQEQGLAELGGGLWVDAATAGAVVEEAVDGTPPADVVVPSQSYSGSDALPIFLTEDGERYAVLLACLRPAGVSVGLGRAGASSPVACEEDGRAVRDLTGDGGPTRVRVEAPDGVVWAAAVVRA